MKGFEGGVTAGEGSRTIGEIKEEGWGEEEEGAGNRVSAGGVGAMLRLRPEGGREGGRGPGSWARGGETEVHEFASTVKLSLLFSFYFF